MATVSIRCISHGPLARTAAILALYRPVADEIVCFVNGLFSPGELAGLQTVCDAVVPVEMTASFTGGRYRPWMLQYGRRHDWVNLIDHDEVPSRALLDSLRGLAESEHVASFAGPRRWLYPDGAHWLHGAPWEPNFKMFLTRTTPTTLVLRAPIHGDMPIVPPARLLDLPSYHLVLLAEDEVAREQKIRHYERLAAQAGVHMPPGFRDRDFYRPGSPQTTALSPVPEQDQALVHAVLQATRTAPEPQRVIPRTALPAGPHDWLPGTVPWQTVAQHWPGRDIAQTATQAALRLWGPSLQQPPIALAAGSRPAVWVQVENTSREIWPREGWDPVIRIGSHWRRQGQRLPQHESRCGLGAAVCPGETAIESLPLSVPEQPGDYELVIGMVAERVAWFGSGVCLPIRVHAATPAQTR